MLDLMLNNFSVIGRAVGGESLFTNLLFTNFSYQLCNVFNMGFTFIHRFMKVNFYKTSFMKFYKFSGTLL